GCRRRSGCFRLCSSSWCFAHPARPIACRELARSAVHWRHWRLAIPGRPGAISTRRSGFPGNPRITDQGRALTKDGRPKDRVAEGRCARVYVVVTYHATLLTHPAARFDIPLRSRSLGVLFADEMEAV